jgi:cation:H+ antiporter
MWYEFTLSALSVIFAGFFLTKYGDEISEKGGISGGFIGFFLLALATSLPELITSISAVVFQNAPELAFGNIFGSNLFNIGILVIVDFLSKNGAFFKSGRENLVSMAYIFIISLIAIIPVILNINFGIGFFRQLPINIESVFILVFYIYILKTFSHSSEELPSEKIKSNESMLPVYLKFIVSAGVIVIAGFFLTKSVDSIAVYYNLGKTFAGSMFLAFVTSLPEATVSISAVRIGAIEMAVGNVLGSNVFNVLIIFFADLFTKRQILYLQELKSSIVTALFSLLIAGVCLYGIIRKSEKSVLLLRKISVPSFFMLIIYVLGMYFTYIVK